MADSDNAGKRDPVEQVLEEFDRRTETLKGILR